MSAFLQCLSHTPLIGRLDPTASVLDEVETYTNDARRRIEEFDPQLVVLFAPDHFMGFFHDVMPSFCIGVEAEAIGDFDTPKGPLLTDPELAGKLAEHCLEHGVDVAVSQRMRVDHGFSQPLGRLLGGINKVPVIPVFVNSVARPLPTFQRARILGETIGNFCKTVDKRVLFLASGGLSHQPPVPEYATASESVRQKLLGNPKHLSPEAHEAMTRRTIKAAKKFVNDQTTLHPLAPEWDLKFMNIISAGNMAELDGIANKTVTETAGASTHEVKTWVAAASAMASFGPYDSVAQYYRPIPEWIAGYGGLTAQSPVRTRQHKSPSLVRAEVSRL
ncbi:unnamed protein product [Zymoseptoria tritici ST99CH_1E4]|uniref:Extradiol ring-cleavage dioxygenase class III enzyme subunit B domain-containing protein n=1 Tax=Zymoseptoria tritici ST99CH_1E4 TaxID=1276532 RepID=A0A2H1H815_ZYMTR|nr:unnamed protein product [Zymoseptoria tritici ST99CH_1E4]